MKYIRTKEGVIFAGPIDNKGTYKCTNLGLWKEVKPVWENNEIIKGADNIEELCDEFVVEVNIHNIMFHDLQSALNVVKNFENYELTKDYKIYGAIWTDKGLIYVAKMNEKGKLELL